MFNALRDLLKIIMKGFISYSYFTLNICAYTLLIIGFSIFIYDKSFIAYIILGFFCILFFSIIYFDWRLNNLKNKYNYLFYQLNSLPGMCVIFAEDNTFIDGNDILFAFIGDKKIIYFKDFLQYFVEYVEIYNTLDNAMQSDSNYVKDVFFGEKIWRINMSLQHSKRGLLKILFLIDISTSKNNHNDQVFANLLNSIDTGVILTHKNGNIYFYNSSASSMLKTSLSGKNIKSICNMGDITPNIKKQINVKNTILNIYLSHYMNEFMFYKIEVEYAQLDNILEEAPFGVVILDSNLKIIGYNKFLFQNIKRNIASIEQVVIDDQRDSFLEYLNACVKNTHIPTQKFNLNISGTHVSAYLKINKSNQVVLFLIEDFIMREFQAQFLHEQRLHSLGEIVGGISHDFNNIIATILATCDIILNRNSFSPTNIDYIDIMRIKHSSSKASNLIKQILNISKKQNTQENMLNVNDVITEFAITIGRILGENIELKINKNKSDLCIMMNEVNFEQILINLILNARDAMQYGGIIHIHTDQIHISKTMFENNYYINKGDYVEISIEDSGVGISSLNIGKIFDPFFTTKSEKGTGFGLSTVNTLVKRQRGFIRVASKLGVFTNFKIYLPLFKENKIKKNYSHIIQKEENYNHQKNILLVEDDKTILFSLTKELKKLNYNVFSCESAEDAITLSENLNNLDLLLTDILMPKMSGIQLYDILKDKFNCKVLFLSGVSNDELEIYKSKKDSNADNIFFLQKPYSISDVYKYINLILRK
jgi:signal transduction histidine kinase/CheY-like chemotaxis protein